MYYYYIMIDLNKIKNIAVIGASANPDKFGNKIMVNLINRGFNVFPVNPKGGKILNRDVYMSLNDLSEDVELLNIVTPPDISMDILKKANNLDFKNVWLQPGAENEEIIEYLKDNNFEYIVQACIMTT